MRKNIHFLFSIALLAVFLPGCGDEEKPMEKPKIIHNNSVEYYVETSRLTDGRVVLKTTQQIYVRRQPYKMLVKLDTLPALGGETVRLEEANKDTSIAKEYDVYFTLK
jgi:hypothetical protein